MFVQCLTNVWPMVDCFESHSRSETFYTNWCSFKFKRVVHKFVNSEKVGLPFRPWSTFTMSLSHRPTQVSGPQGWCKLDCKSDFLDWLCDWLFSMSLRSICPLTNRSNLVRLLLTEVQCLSDLSYARSISASGRHLRSFKSASASGRPLRSFKCKTENSSFTVDVNFRRDGRCTKIRTRNSNIVTTNGASRWAREIWDHRRSIIDGKYDSLSSGLQKTTHIRTSENPRRFNAHRRRLSTWPATVRVILWRFPIPSGVSRHCTTVSVRLILGHGYGPIARVTRDNVGPKFTPVIVKTAPPAVGKSVTRQNEQVLIISRTFC